MPEDQPLVKLGAEIQKLLKVGKDAVHLLRRQVTVQWRVELLPQRHTQREREKERKREREKERKREREKERKREREKERKREREKLRKRQTRLEKKR